MVYPLEDGHPSRYWAWCALTSLMQRMPLTTTPRCQHTNETHFKFKGEKFPSQCRINANRGPWQLFAQAPLLTWDEDLSQPATRVHTTCWQLFRPAINTAHFYFLLQKLCQITWLPTGWKILFSTSEGPPWGLRPVAFATTATWLIRHSPQ